jgi:hypothetical protein
MGDTPLYTRLKRLDAGIARVYFELTRDDPKAIIDLEGVEKLFEQALGRDDKITARELDALIAIFDRDAGCFTADVPDLLSAAFGSRLIVESLGKGTGTPLATDDELAEVFIALDVAGNNVDFKSPQTGLSYNLSAYQAIKELVKNKEILVMSVKDKGQVWERGHVGAMYDAKLKLPVVFVFEKPADQRLRLGSLVRELTHAFQDRSDIQSDIKFIETDALLAEGLVVSSLGLTAPKEHPILPLIDVIRRGRNRSDPKAWSDAYNAAADIVAKGPRYAWQVASAASSSIASTWTKE